MSIDTQFQPLKDRIEKALADFTSGRASMHVPPMDTDVDMVLADCATALEAAEKRIAELEALAGMEGEPVAMRPSMLFDQFVSSITKGQRGLPDALIKDGVVDYEKIGVLWEEYRSAPQPLTASERAELENYRNAQQVVPSITQHFDDIALETAREIMCDVNRRHEFLGGEVQLLSRIQCRVDDACRAATLQGKAEPVSNHDELPLDYLQGHKDGLEWAAQLAEANHPQTGDWLYDDPVELAKAIRKGPDMPELKSVSVDEDDNFYSWFGRFWYKNYQQNNYTTSAKQMLCTMAEFAFRAGRESATQAGNSPVIPDGWVACSERMPEDAQWCAVSTEYGYYVQCWSHGQGWLGDDISIPNCDVTHWMPLPAAPQREAE